MENYLKRIKIIKKEVLALAKESFRSAKSGTRHAVFLSDNFVIRFKDKESDRLKREAELLHLLKHPLIPKTVWGEKIGGKPVIIENRLPGQTLDLIWRLLPKTAKNQIINDLLNFLIYLRTNHKNQIYSIKTGKHYPNFLKFLTDGLESKIKKISKYDSAKKLAFEINSILKSAGAINLFTTTSPSLVHGDLIIHNLLTDGRHLTGVLDWEFALWGDSDYDLARIWYYHECAKAYEQTGEDKTFEADFTNHLIQKIIGSKLMVNQNLFLKKYNILRAFFYLNALTWACSSAAPKKNIAELTAKWLVKNRGCQI